jgi:hypothetical protein
MADTQNQQPGQSTAPAAASPVVNQLARTLFTLGVTAAAIFVKNPHSQEKAGIIIQALQSLMPHISED